MQSVQISQKKDGHSIYVIMKAMSPPSYHHIGFMAAHALGPMINGYMWYINVCIVLGSYLQILCCMLSSNHEVNIFEHDINELLKVLEHYVVFRKDTDCSLLVCSLLINFWKLCPLSIHYSLLQDGALEIISETFLCK